MGFFYNLTKKTNQITKKITIEAKLKMKINENKSCIREIYEEIGTIIYEKHIREENINIKDELKNQCSKLDELSKEIEQARMEILKLNNKKMCTKCFAEIESYMQFCPNCGKKQNEEKTVFEETEEKLENVEISPENIVEAEIVKQELEEKNNDE